jgi:carboxyl-terminal processing protease
MPHYKRNIHFFLFLILPILGFLLGWSLSQKTTEQTQNPTTVTEKNTATRLDNIIVDLNAENLKKKVNKEKVDLSIFWETWGALESNYLQQEKFNVKEQVYGATRGLVASLKDPYTTFMSPEEMAKFEESISGEFEGIGAEIAIKDDHLTVVTPLKGAPAELAGLRAGDVIYKIDGKTTFDLSVEEAVTKIRGPKGEKVVLSILRKGEVAPLEITIVRDNIFIPSVEFEMKEDVAVITLSQFGSELVREFKKIIPEIGIESPKGIVLDLRNNGGGLLDAAISIATEFFDQKTVVKTKGRNLGDTGELKSGKGGVFTTIPLIILTNEGSASASEIFAGAIQDHKRGVVIGEKTFGKGSVQNVLPLSDGSSLKVTIAEWLTPAGRSINEKGIAPDIEVKTTREDIENKKDPVLDRALELMGTEEMDKILKGEYVEVKDPVVEVLGVPEEKTEENEEKTQE